MIQRFKDNLKAVIGLAFELIKFAPSSLLSRSFTKPYKCPHDQYIYLYSAIAAEALLDSMATPCSVNAIRQISSTAIFHFLRSQTVHLNRNIFSSSKLKHEIIRKSLTVAL